MSFPEQPFGFVAGRWVRSIGDTPDDADRAPDYVPVETGTVVFTPQVTHRVAADGTGWAGIIKDRIPARLGERGQLIDAEGHDHLALAVGVYSVSYDFGSGRSWPSHYIEVRQEHTADSPLWLPPIAPPPEGPMIENRVITIPADGADGQVLVWDGAGFSWADPPKGDKGDQGDPGTSDIVVDTSVGTKVTTNGVVVYYNSGWRNVSSLLINGWTGSVRIRRRLDTIDFRFFYLDGTQSTSTSFIELPGGFNFGASGTEIPVGAKTIIYGASTKMLSMPRTEVHFSTGFVGVSVPVAASNLPSAPLPGTSL